MAVFLTYIIVITILSFIFMGVDKWKAIRRKRRIPEKNLLLLACLGGFIGIIAGMMLFRHKIRKPAFTLLVPFIALFEIAAAFYISRYF
ncbi:DUF1294 domain-containing protein [Bacillus piscicola]|uniref:DUF1294 domain-containing protein n=1 Tax=Bacillus piscicola TaxID=1632684 RepID=UPI001F09D18B|nr:DUF1294 domain-containing protein [Bacillus piscicola]